jgi:predicted NAD-dependent protein-ADP-ribosyltransferase YbiA (DUF1768 family)
MLTLLREKFRDWNLRDRLLNTGDAILIEGNTWHDTYWGHCICPRCHGGANFLGILLTQVRTECLAEERNQHNAER